LRPTLGEKDWEQCGLYEQKRFPNQELAALGHGHISVQQIAHFLPGNSFEDFFSFAFVRNPYDRFVSYCAFINRHNRTMQHDALSTMKSVLDHKAQVPPVLMRPQAQFLTDENQQILISHIARFEDIQAGISQVLQRIGVDAVPLPALNRSDHRPYQSYYDIELKEMVDDYYELDFTLLNYPRDLSIPQ